jgi:hypothetical protein
MEELNSSFEELGLKMETLGQKMEDAVDNDDTLAQEAIKKEF